MRRNISNVATSYFLNFVFICVMQLFLRAVSVFLEINRNQFCEIECAFRKMLTAYVNKYVLQLVRY